MERDYKVENIALWIKNLNAEAEAIKAEEKRLASRRKANENRARSLKEYLRVALQGEKFKTPKCAISYRTTRDVVTVDELGEIPETFFKTPHYESNLDKTKIKKMLKEGATIAGVHLQDNQSIVIK